MSTLVKNRQFVASDIHGGLPLEISQPSFHGTRSPGRDGESRECEARTLSQGPGRATRSPQRQVVVRVSQRDFAAGQRGACREGGGACATTALGIPALDRAQGHCESTFLKEFVRKM